MYFKIYVEIYFEIYLKIYIVFPNHVYLNF